MPLYNAIRKYGKNSFSISILEDDIPQELLDEKEMYYIDKYNTFREGYNNTIGGGGTKHYKHTDIIKHKIGEAIMRNKNKIYTIERAMKISKSNKGVPKSLEHRKKLSEYRLKNRELYCGSNNAFYGKKHSDKSIEKMSYSHRKYSIIQLDKNTQEIINKFEDINKATQYVKEKLRPNTKLSSIKYRIYKTCKGIQTECYGYYWKYINKM